LENKKMTYPKYHWCPEGCGKTVRYYNTTGFNKKKPGQEDYCCEVCEKTFTKEQIRNF